MSPRPKRPIGAHGVIQLDAIERVTRQVLAPSGATVNKSFHQVIKFTGVGAAEREKKHTLWRARARLRDMSNKLKSVEALGESPAKAQRALERKLVEKSQHISAVIAHSPTLGEFADKWLDMQLREDLSPVSISAARYALRRILPAWGEVPIGEITTGKLELWLREQRATVASRSGKSSSEAGHGASKTIRSALSGIFGLAVESDVIPVNPVTGMRRIKRPEGPRGAIALTEKQAAEFLSTIREDPQLRALDISDILELQFWTGIRIGEACALRWDRVNLEDSTISIDATVTRETGKGAYIKESPKTASSNRVVPLTAAAVELLQRRSTTALQSPEGVVFPSQLGHLRDVSNTTRDIRKNRERLGLEGFTTHSLRKTLIGILGEAGVSDRDISDMAGHSDINFTRSTYTPRKRVKREPAEALEGKYGVNAELRSETSTG